MEMIFKLSHGSGMTGWMAEGNTLDIFFYNDDLLRRIDSYQRTEIGAGMSADAASRKGKKIAVAILNPQKEEYAWNSISSYETLVEMNSDLRKEDPSAPLMCGMARISALNDCSFEINVEPLLSEIYIRSIKCDFSGRPYRGEMLKNASVYLTNVNAIAGIMDDEECMPSAPINTDGYPDESSECLEHPEMLYAEFGQDIGTETLEPGISLFCYPNSSEKDTAGSPFTRLVIAGDIGGHRYYYPVNINQGEFGITAGHSGIRRNCRYIFDIVITKTGVADPCVPVSGETVSINGNIEPWSELPVTNIEF